MRQNRLQSELWVFSPEVKIVRKTFQIFHQNLLDRFSPPIVGIVPTVWTRLFTTLKHFYCHFFSPAVFVIIAQLLKRNSWKLWLFPLNLLTLFSFSFFSDRLDILSWTKNKNHDNLSGRCNMFPQCCSFRVAEMKWLGTMRRSVIRSHQRKFLSVCWSSDAESLGGKETRKVFPSAFDSLQLLFLSLWMTDTNIST